MTLEKNAREFTIGQLLALSEMANLPICLLDVRLDAERESTKITIKNSKANITEKHISIPRSLFQNAQELHHYLTKHIHDLPIGDIIIVYCHGGSRSLNVTNILIDRIGFKSTQVFSLQGGVVAWNKQVQAN